VALGALAVLLYVNVLRARYYFPGRYEDGFRLSFAAIAVGLPAALIWARLALRSASRRRRESAGAAGGRLERRGLTRH
jgi:hypothetical protein